MLTPETLNALDQALAAVVKEAGDDPQYAELVDHLTAAQGAMPDAGEPKEEGPDPESFEDAKSQMIAARKGAA